jgi:hypothetical protein
MREADMWWINEHKNVWRVAALVLLAAAIMGPWGYTGDGVPPPEWCHAPFFLLENGHCVGLVTGETVLPDRAREFLGVFLLTVSLFLLVLPFFTTLLLIWRRDSRRVHVFHLIAWGLAAVLSLLPVVFESALRSGRFWGIWLYAGSAAGALILEALWLAARRRPSSLLGR